MRDRRRNFGFLLKEVSRRYVLRFEELAAAIPLTLSECKVLVRLEENEGVSQTRLAGITDIEPMTMVRLLDRMAADGLLERRPDPEDRRARRLHLTAKAKPVLEQIWQLSDATRAETFAGVSRTDRERVISVLERMYANLCTLQEGRVGRPTPNVARAQSIIPPAAARLRRSRAR
ncbi:MAG TPA: MarR family transcriptional regulator [Steroidobacteraceae bacterium]